MNWPAQQQFRARAPSSSFQKKAWCSTDDSRAVVLNAALRLHDNRTKTMNQGKVQKRLSNKRLSYVGEVGERTHVHSAQTLAGGSVSSTKLTAANSCFGATFGCCAWDHGPNGHKRHGVVACSAPSTIGICLGEPRHCRTHSL